MEQQDGKVLGRACWPVSLRVRCVADVAALYAYMHGPLHTRPSSICGRRCLSSTNMAGKVARLARWSGCVADNGCGVGAAHGPANEMA
jgi:hypothetical protein